MRARLTRAVMDRLLPQPELATGEALRRVLRRGSPGFRIRALRAHGTALGAAALVGWLQDPVPGVRRSAAWALAAGRHVDGLDALWAAARVERMDAVRLAMAVAAVRLGADVSRAWGVLDHAARRRMASFYGPRPVAEAAGAGPGQMARRWFRTLAPQADHHGDPALIEPVDPQRLRERFLARLDGTPDDRTALLELAVQQHPDDLDRILGRKWVSGRRESHVVCEALGEHGDPRSISTLVRVLQAMDVDPGHGFAGRRVSSIALGRIGDPVVGPVLSRALVNEALDHEGRPGAGLGIQFPVRTVMLSALGEAGCTHQATVLASYLANTSGSALGGFYLPAMDALWKLDCPEPLRDLLARDALPAANAVGVLAAMGQEQLVRAQLEDGRQQVAAAAADGLRLLAAGVRATDERADPAASGRSEDSI